MSNVKNGTDSNLADLLKSPNVLLQFSAEWCGPCKMLSPIIDDLASQYDNISVVKINVDESSQTAMKYNIRGVPTVLFIKDGEIIDRFSGFKPKPEIEEKINNILI
jgi:thioredoxin 1